MGNSKGLTCIVVAGLILLVTLAESSAKVTVAPPTSPPAKSPERPKPALRPEINYSFDSPAGLHALHEFSITTLRRGLADQDQFERLFAASALGVNGDPIGAMMLEEGFHSPDPSIRMASADGLADIGDAKAAAVLQRLLDETSDGYRRRLLVEALSQVKDHAAVVALVEASKEPDPGMRMEAALALGRLGRTEAVPQLRSLLTTERNAFTRTIVAHALLLLGDSTGLETLKVALERGSDSDVKGMAAVALGDARDPAVVAPLERALAGGDLEVRMAAAAALTHYSRRDGLWLLKAAITDRDFFVRHRLGNLLEHLDLTVGREVVVAALSAHDAGLQLAATKAMGLLGGDEEVTTLIKLFHRTEDPILRADIAWALGRIARPACIEPLIDMVAEPDAAVRYTAADALARTTNRLLNRPQN